MRPWVVPRWPVAIVSLSVPPVLGIPYEELDRTFDRDPSEGGSQILSMDRDPRPRCQLKVV